MKRRRADIALAGVTIVWGTTFVVVKAALANVSPLLFLAMRFAVAAIALLLIYRKHWSRKGLAQGLVAGLLLFTAYVFQTTGLKLTTPAKSAFLTGLSIPMVPLFGSLVYKVRPRPPEAAGILIASLGMILMTLPPSSSPRVLAIGRGDFLSLLCAATFALHIVVIGHFSAASGFESIAVTQVATAAILASVFFRVAEPVRFHLTPGVAVAVLVTGLLATALAFTVQAWAQQHTPANRAAVIYALEPVVAWLTSYLLTGETLARAGVAGAGLILAGILLVELKRIQGERHHKRGAAFLDV